MCTERRSISRRSVSSSMNICRPNSYCNGGQIGSGSSIVTASERNLDNICIPAGKYGSQATHFSHCPLWVISVYLSKRIPLTLTCHHRCLPASHSRETNDLLLKHALHRHYMANTEQREEQNLPTKEEILRRAVFITAFCFEALQTRYMYYFVLFLNLKCNQSDRPDAVWMTQLSG